MPRRKIEFRFEGYERVAPPNFEQIASLVKRAKGHRSLTEFAELCDMSLPSMSIIASAKTKSPLSDKLIKAIAENAVPESGISVELLLEANGMAKINAQTDVSNDGLTRIYDVESRVKFGVFFEEMSRELISASLLSKGYTVTLCMKNLILFDGIFSRLCPDFSAEIKMPDTGEVKIWAFDTILTNGTVSHKTLFDKFSTLLTSAYFMQLRDKGVKFSFVIDNAQALNDIKEQFENRKVSDDISVILVDSVNKRIVEEYILPTTSNEGIQLRII